MLTLIVFSPLIGAALLGLFGRRWNERLIGLVGCASVGISMLTAYHVFFARLLPLEPEKRMIVEPVYQWIESGLLRASFGFQLDQLSGVYSLFVTFVAFWIHIFATGYMRGESGLYRFFAYMNLFMFMMLVLVLADNFLLMFVGWEGVGLCSYLLIGFYFTREEAADAAKKAFIVNRIGDFGFALGIIMIFTLFGTIQFSEVAFMVSQLPVEPIGTVGVLTIICLLLFLGCTGKSAQIPLFVWLPDAMAGPTPVSALIHAATMVTAGVYLVARTSELFVHAPTAMCVIAVIGGLTAFLAATMALGQHNIKKVLAYSTISQLGYMFLACGVGAFVAGIFHVVTHAFFKALLFLGSGSVILAMHHHEDMRDMGGLKNYLPITYRTFLIGWFALAGIFPFAGFFSKDEILWRTWSTTVLPKPWGPVLWVLGLMTTVLTMVYMTRLMVMTFYSEERFDYGKRQGHHQQPTPHESPASMTVPLIVLAALSIIGGWIGVSEAVSFGFVPNWFEHFLHPAVATAPVLAGQEAGAEHASQTLELGLAGLTLALVIVSGVVAYRTYLRNVLWTPPSVLVNKYWVDEVYDRLLVQPIKVISTTLLWRFFDVKIIDGTVNGVAALVKVMGRGLRYMQTGLVRTYAVMIFLGALMIIGYFVFGGR